MRSFRLDVDCERHVVLLADAEVYAFYILLGGLGALFGMGFSGVMTSVWVVVRELVPPRVAATSLAVVVMFAWFVMGLGGWHGGHAFDMTGSYHRPYLDAVFSGLVNLVIVGALMRRVGQARARVIPAPHPAG